MRTLMSLCASLAVLVLSSCAVLSKTETTAAPTANQVKAVEPSGPAAEPSKAENDEDKELKRAKLQRSLDVAREKVERSEMALAHQLADTQAILANAERAHELAVRKLRVFQDQDAPLRLDQARLSHQRAEDYAQEQQEELQQLEMMYTEEDLADKTAEIVLNRGRRRLERAQRALELETIELTNLEEHHLPMEQADLQKDVDEKARSLEQARRKGELDRLDQEIAVMEAKAEVTGLEAELATLEKELKKEEVRGEEAAE
jgi:hypothetical protein